MKKKGCLRKDRPTQPSLKMTPVGKFSLLGFGTGPFFFPGMFLTQNKMSEG